MCISKGAPTLLFIGQGHPISEPQLAPKHPRTSLRTNRGAPCGRPGSANPRSVRPICGSTDPTWPCLALCFLSVTDMWSPKAVPGAHGILRWFARYVGPSIHVTPMWQRVIRRACFPWIGDVIDPGGSYVATPHWLSLKCLDQRHVLLLSFLMLNACI